MKKQFAVVSLIIMIALFIGGLYILASSVDIGQEAGKKAINSNGGSMDTQQYYGVINQATENYRLGGIIISVTGGAGILLSGYGIYKGI